MSRKPRYIDPHATVGADRPLPAAGHLHRRRFGMNRHVLSVALAWFLVTAMSFGVPSPSSAEDGPAVLQRVLHASGLDQLGTKKRIAFTFHVEAGETNVTRAWDWNLETDSVRQDGADVGKTPKFINDAYWLLFPAMVAWDQGKVELTAEPSVIAPLTKQETTKLVVRYIDGVGSTPNDRYDLYVSGEGEVVEWSYHKAGAEAPTRQTAWGGYEVIGGLRLSLDRPGDGFRVWFTDVVVE